MRERSHRKGKRFQKNTRTWLMKSSLFGYKLEGYGDAYDLSRKAASIGGKYFDFSLKLILNDEVQAITFAECKFRTESLGNVNSEFAKFLDNVYCALKNADTDEFNSSEFLFISNIPPDKWRLFINNRNRFLINSLKERGVNPNIDITTRMKDCINILILSEKIVRN